MNWSVELSEIRSSGLTQDVTACCHIPGLGVDTQHHVSDPTGCIAQFQCTTDKTPYRGKVSHKLTKEGSRFWGTLQNFGGRKGGHQIVLCCIVRHRTRSKGLVIEIAPRGVSGEFVTGDGIHYDTSHYLIINCCGHRDTKHRIPLDKVTGAIDGIDNPLHLPWLGGGVVTGFFSPKYRLFVSKAGHQLLFNATISG